MALLTAGTAGAAIASDVGGAAAGVAERVRQSVVEVRPRRGGAGAGTIWREDGIVVTNYHVAGRDRAQVRLADGRTFEGHVVAFDARNDLAVLSIPASDLPAAEIGDARRLRPGELVLAVGHPYGVRNAVTVGVVNSALPDSPRGGAGEGRPQPDSSPEGTAAEGTAAEGTAPEGGKGQGARIGGAPAEVERAPRATSERVQAGARERNRLWRWGQGRELVMADVLLGPGNSGGPLVDARGRVVGINAMVGNGLALAVPSHLVQRLLARQGDPPRLGVSVQDVFLPAPLASLAGVEPGAAAMVVETAPGSPAAHAGLLLGDVLVAVDGVALDGSGGLLNALEAHSEGPVSLTLIRGGEVREVAVPVESARPAEVLRAA
jgi:S1-C subfamily serine protease